MKRVRSVFFIFVVSLLYAILWASDKTAGESARAIPIVHDVDIVIVGGSSAGVAAAVEAAENGASVFLAAPRHYLGEDLCATYRLWLDPNEVPNSLLAKNLFKEPPRIGLSFTYETDIPSSSTHEDTDPPSLLCDGLYFNASTQSVQYDDDVNIVVDMNDVCDIGKVHVVAYQRNDDYEVEYVTVSTSNDKENWQQVALIINEELGESSVDLCAPLTETARYVRFFVHMTSNADRILLGEIVIEQQDEGRIPPSPMQVKSALDEALLDSGVHYFFGCYATDVLRDENGNLAGIAMVNRSGRQAVKAKVIIDATHRATIARIAGVDFQPYFSGVHTFKRIVVGGNIQTGEEIQARTMPSLIPNNGNEYEAFEYTLDINMEDGSFASFAKAEQVARDMTWDPNQVDASEVLFEVPPDPMYGKTSFEGDWPGPNSIDLDVFRPADVNQLYVLGGCADMSRSAAEQLLRPLNYLEVGRRIGQAAASDANELCISGQILISGQVESDSVSGDVYEILNGARPVQLCLPTILNESRTIPVFGEYDVVVVGGGTSGAPAGIGAARQGKTVLVIEYLHGLGGVGTIGLIGRYSSASKGFSKEIDDGVTDLGGRVKIDNRYYWKVENKMEWYRSELCKAGADIWFGILGCGAYVEDGIVKGVVVATPDGRGVVLAKVVIDSTGNSDIAIAAGADYMFTEDDHVSLQGTGLPPRNLGDIMNNTDYTFIDDSDLLDIWRAIVLAKKRYFFSYDLSQLIDTRERRRIVGDYVISPLNIHNNSTYHDTINRSCAAYDTHGYTVHPSLMFVERDSLDGCYYTPYRSLLPKNIEGILVTGLGMSAHRDAIPVLRMQPDFQNQGYAAGVAAAMAADANDYPRFIDVNELQNHLVEIGNISEGVLEHEDSIMFSMSEIAQAVEDVVDEYSGIGIIFTQPDDALPLLQDAYEAADSPDKIIYAEILGVLGDATGSSTLAQTIQEQNWDTGWNWEPWGGPFDNSLSPLDVQIIALGNTRSSLALNPIIEKVELLSSSSEFSHHRAVAIALETLGDPAAAEPLANLLEKPGMSGFAYTDINTPPITTNRGYPLRELILARALYRCGDYSGLAESILSQYEIDLCGHYARHAHAVLKEKCPDFNDDCIVDSHDLTVIGDEWLNSGNEILGDLSGDGKVDLVDLLILSTMWLENILWPSSSLP